jgi:hypothetical protein
MADDTFLRDISAIQEDLNDVAGSGSDIARSASWAFVGVLKRAAVNVALGNIKKEIGGYVKTQGEQLISRVGLLAMPVRGRRGPHGVFLELGTKYIVARHTISMAMEAALAIALNAAERAAQKKINSILRKGK